MTRYLLDTSVLVRYANTSDLNHPIAVRGLRTVAVRGDECLVCPQALIEFRSVATRPVGPANGLGLSAPVADALIAQFEREFPLLPDTADIYPTWKQIVAGLGIEGKTVHDARLTAVCRTHGVGHILTFNTQHFVRLATFQPLLTVWHPAQV